ncbi:MAG: nucleotidyltransferase domain-containing protein [Gaiellaceae bacterium]
MGIYLQGSFALGAGDEWSDVDFVVATRQPIGELSGLNALHAELFERRTGWAKHLEGSYIDVGLLRQVDAERTPVRSWTTARRSWSWIDTATQPSSAGSSGHTASHCSGRRRARSSTKSCPTPSAARHGIRSLTTWSGETASPT